MRSVTLPLALALSLLIAAPAHAGLEEDLAQAEARVVELEARVGSVRQERSEIVNAVLDLAADLDVLLADLAAAQDRLVEVEHDVAATEDAIDEMERRVARHGAQAAELERRVGMSRETALERVVQLYMSTDAGGPSLLVVDDAQGSLVGLLYADSAVELARREVSTLELLRAEERRAVEWLDAERAELEAAVARLEDVRGRREVEMADVAARTAQVASRLADQQTLLAEIDAQVAELDGELAALAAEQARIEQLIAEEQSAGGTTPGVLLRPVRGGVSSGFGYRVHPIYGDQRLHTGWDMNAGCGEPIRAAAGGRVFLADWKGGYGITVMVDHGGGMVTLYAHQSRAIVAYGQQVSPGDVVGYVGTTGVSTGCHLHFEVRLGGTPVDPSPYL